jgi:hypothetical protein
VTERCACRTDHGSTAGTVYRVGQRVFGRHGATQEYFSGYVLTFAPGQVFPYVLDVGRREPIHVLGSEIQSDLPSPGATTDDIMAWLGDDSPA